MNKLFTKAAMLIAIFAIAAMSAAAQVTGGAVTGTVVDPNGAVVRGATVSLKDKSRGLEITTTTTDAGNYQFPNVHTGTYTMTVTAAGFSPAAGDITGSLNQTSTANITLTVGPSTAVVDRTSETQTIVQTDTSQMGLTFKERQVQDLPVNGDSNNHVT